MAYIVVIWKYLKIGENEEELSPPVVEVRASVYLWEGGAYVRTYARKNFYTNKNEKTTEL